MPTPQDRRFAAIRAIGKRFITEEGNLAAGVYAEEVAQEIEKMASLGRTERWKGTVAYWASMVRESTEPNSHGLEWAIRQGSIFVGQANI